MGGSALASYVCAEERNGNFNSLFPSLFPVGAPPKSFLVAFLVLFYAKRAYQPNPAQSCLRSNAHHPCLRSNAHRGRCTVFLIPSTNRSPDSSVDHLLPCLSLLDLCGGAKRHTSPSPQLSSSCSLLNILCLTSDRRAKICCKSLSSVFSQLIVHRQSFQEVRPMFMPTILLWLEIFSLQSFEGVIVGTTHAYLFSHTVLLSRSLLSFSFISSQNILPYHGPNARPSSRSSCAWRSFARCAG